MKPTPVKVTVKQDDMELWLEPYRCIAKIINKKIVMGFHDRDGNFIEVKESYKEVAAKIDDSLKRFNDYIFNDDNYYQSIRER